MAAPVPPGTEGPPPGTARAAGTRRATTSGGARRRIALLLGLGAVAAFGAAMLRPEAPPPAGPPNLVMVVWDTVRADRVGCYGAPVPTTPFLDGLARDGAIFESALAPSPWTAPSHASLFTGLRPPLHRLVVPRQALGFPRPRLLAETLAAAGYETVGLSANANISKLTGLDAGFQWFALHHEEAEPRPVPALRAVRKWLADRASRERAGERRPVFLFVNLMDAHLVYRPDPRWLAAVRPPGISDEALAAAGRVGDLETMAHNLGIRRIEPGTLAALRVLYDACVRQADETTREIHGLLGEAGLLGNAVFVVASDHGENLGEHGLLEHRLSVHESVLRIPMVLHAPGRVAAGTVVHHRVMLQDLYAEFLDRAGVPPPMGTGLNAISPWTAPPSARRFAAEYAAPLPLLAPAASEWFPDAPRELLRPLRTSLASSRTPHGHPRHLKYIRYDVLDDAGVPGLDREEIFDLDADPSEERNLLEGPNRTPEEERLARLLRSQTAPATGAPK